MIVLVNFATYKRVEPYRTVTEMHISQPKLSWSLSSITSCLYRLTLLLFCRCGSLQVGDRVIAINHNPPPSLMSLQCLDSLVQRPSVTLTVEFAVAQTVMPTSGVFTVRLANNKVAGLGITISGQFEHFFSVHFCYSVRATTTTFSRTDSSRVFSFPYLIFILPLAQTN